MNTEYSKPKVTIDLDEYDSLKRMANREELLPILKMGQRVSINSQYESLKGSVTQINRQDPLNPIFNIITQKGVLMLSISYENI
jgi:hypothetical protein